MSNRDHLTIDQLTGARRVRTRQEKVGLAISMVAFFGAIGVVGWFGISGYQADDGSAASSGPRVLFAGGETSSAPVAASSDTDTATVADDQYVVGNFGDPVTELYAEDDDGGWGASALATSSSDSGDDGSGTPRVGRISRGRGGN